MAVIAVGTHVDFPQLTRASVFPPDRGLSVSYMYSLSTYQSQVLIRFSAVLAKLRRSAHALGAESSSAVQSHRSEAQKYKKPIPIMRG